MCIILIGEIGRARYDLASSQNPDGFSLFTREQGLVKAPTQAQVQEAIYQFGLWHFRIATSGRIDTNNIHPFRICKGRYLLYHNGVLGEGKGKLSDTAALAETLYEVNLTTARSVLRALSIRNKFLVADARDPKNFEVFGEWVVEGGVIMSHRFYTKGGKVNAAGIVFER